MKSLPLLLSVLLVSSISATAQSAVSRAGTDSSTAVSNNATSALPKVSDQPAATPADQPTAAESTLAGSLSSSRTVSTIQTQELDTRDRLIAQLSERVQGVDQKVTQMKTGASSLQGDPLANFNTAWSEYQKSKQRFDQTLQSAKAASTPAAWDRARSALAAEYAFYVAAVAGVEVAIPNS